MEVTYTILKNVCAHICTNACPSHRHMLWSASLIWLFEWFGKAFFHSLLSHQCSDASFFASLIIMHNFTPAPSVLQNFKLTFYTLRTCWLTKHHRALHWEPAGRRQAAFPTWIGVDFRVTSLVAQVNTSLTPSLGLLLLRDSGKLRAMFNGKKTSSQMDGGSCWAANSHSSDLVPVEGLWGLGAQFPPCAQIPAGLFSSVKTLTCGSQLRGDEVGFYFNIPVTV